MTVYEKLKYFLPNTDPTTLRPGNKVLCFQPASRQRNTMEIFLISKATGLGRGPGWWIGVVESIDDEGWVIVKDEDAEHSWDCDGDEFSIYKITSLPPRVQHLFNQTEHLRNFIDGLDEQTIEEEFFSR